MVGRNMEQNGLGFTSLHYQPERVKVGHVQKAVGYNENEIN